MKTVSFFSDIDGVWMKNVFTFSLSLNYLILTQGYVFHWFTTVSFLNCRRVFCFNGKTRSIEGFLQKRGFPFSRIKNVHYELFYLVQRYICILCPLVCVFSCVNVIFSREAQIMNFFWLLPIFILWYERSQMAFFCNKRSDEQFSHVITIISRIQRNTKVW